MQHYVWHWSYTVEALVVVLALFFLCSLALLWSTSLSNRRQRQTSRIVHTPRGKVDLKRMSMRGLERARTRQYHVKGRE